MKKLVAILLVLLLLILAGCHVAPPDITTVRQTDPIPEETLVRPPEPTENPYEYPPEDEEPPVIQVQYLPAEINASSDVPVLKWVCLMESFQGGRQGRVWNETAVHELNEMLEDLDAGFQIQFVMVTTDKSLYYYDWFSRSEVQELVAEADLLYGYIPQKDMPKYLAPITQYTTGMLANAVPHSAYWDCGTVNGEIYGIRTNVVPASTMGWYVDESVVADLGLTAADFAVDFWEMDELLAQIDTELLGRFLYVGQDSISRDVRNMFWSGYYPSALDGIDALQKVGSCYAIDYSGETPQVANFLELPEIRKYQEAVIRYKKLGYGTDDWEKVKLRYGYGGYTEPTSTYGDLYIPVTEPYFNPSGATYISGIAAGTEYMEEAASLLGLIANSKDFRMQLFFGKEDRDYTNKDGMYAIIQQEDGSDYSMDFLSPLAFFCDLTQDPDKGSAKSPATLDNASLAGDTGAEKLEYLRNALDNAKIYLPVTFDFTGYEEECEGIKWVLRRYYPYMTNEKSSKYTNKPEMTPALYDLMLEDLRDAGADDLRWELQEQLNEWLKQNPDWNK